MAQIKSSFFEPKKIYIPGDGPQAPDIRVFLPKIQPRTGLEPVNLILTKDVLYLLSYLGDLHCPSGQ